MSRNLQQFRFALLFLGSILMLLPQITFADNQHPPAANTYMDSEAAHGLIDYADAYPFNFAWDMLSLNPKFTINHIRIGYGPELTYFFNANWYVQGYYLYMQKNNYETQALLGWQADERALQPYVELFHVADFAPHTRTQSTVNYDVGLNFTSFGAWVPTIEFDNFFNRQTFTFVPQLTVALNKRFSINWQFSYTPHNGNSSLFMKMVYAF